MTPNERNLLQTTARTLRDHIDRLLASFECDEPGYPPGAHQCPHCDRTVAPFNECFSGWIAACGRRLVNFDECGCPAGCKTDAHGEAILPARHPSSDAATRAGGSAPPRKFGEFVLCYPGVPTHWHVKPEDIPRAEPPAPDVDPGEFAPRRQP